MTIHASATWRRLDVHGADSCALLRTEGGWALEGRADFADEHGRARLLYRIDCARDWSTDSAEICGFVGSTPVYHRIVRDRGWSLDGEKAQGLDALIDIDFGFTPATNFLLMRRLSFPLGESVDVSVAWFDLGKPGLTNLPQRYTRRSPREFWYRQPSAMPHASRSPTTALCKTIQGFGRMTRGYDAYPRVTSHPKRRGR